MTTKHIVILGGAYSGVTLAHRILKLKETGKTTVLFKITMVTPNTHFYWNLAAPRALIPGELADEHVFLDIVPGFAHYPAGSFNFILGFAEGLDVEAKTVTVGLTTANRQRKTIQYDYLILATGSQSFGDVPFKGRDSTETTKDALHDYQLRIENAKTVIIAGAGPTGVEFAGELAYKYGIRKEIILVASGSTLVPESPASVGNTVQKQLQSMGVAVMFKNKVVSSTTSSDGKVILTLADGAKKTADVYFPAFGLIPNSSYVPAKFCNSDGFVVVDEYFSVKGANDVYAIGDVCDVDPLQFIYADRQSTFLSKHFSHILGTQPFKPYKALPLRIMGVSVGKEVSTGHWGWVKMPGFVAFAIRKNLFLPNLEPTVSGKIGNSLF